MNPATESLISGLDSFRLAEREEALRSLLRQTPHPPDAGTNVNMHVHSFFSFNVFGWSPTCIAWEARQKGLYAAGLCDFDVLDGLEEFLAAGRALGLRATVNIETRTFLPEFAEMDINSPGEPGVAYLMGAGFDREVPAGAPQAGPLADFRRSARARNEALVRRINARLDRIALDYERDVLPLTPAGVATERHIVRAYLARSRRAFPRPEALNAFWSEVLTLPPEQVSRAAADEPGFEERVRAKLVKRGGIGYETPSPRSFPPAGEFVAWVRSCGAIPMIGWLDGTSEGERNALKMLECLTAKGAAALNIIPDRNWNIADPAARGVKTAKLREMVEAAETFHLPINIGTEMNRDGLPFADDLNGEALRQYREIFLRGARILVGHTWLLRYAGISFIGAEAEAEFGRDRAAKNRFFESVGRLLPVTESLHSRLLEMGKERAGPALADSAKQGRWLLS